MSKKRNEDDDIIERLEKENRELRIENRALLKRLKKVDRNFNKRNNREEKEHEPDFDCPSCQKGWLVEIIMGPRVLDRCSTCDYRSKTRKI
jgi:hypothetical protein